MALQAGWYNVWQKVDTDSCLFRLEVKTYDGPALDMSIVSHTCDAVCFTEISIEGREKICQISIPTIISSLLKPFYSSSLSILFISLLFLSSWVSEALFCLHLVL